MVGRPPSAKTLVDRQLGRNTPNPVIPAGETFIVPNHSGDHSAGRVDSTPVDELDMVNKQYVDSLIRGNVELFLTEDSSDIATYFDLAADSTGNPEETITQTITASGTTLIASFASILNESIIESITDLENGIYSMHTHALSNFPNKMTLYFEFYRRTSGGTETLLGTSHDSDILTVSDAQYDLHANILEDLVWDTGDRVVVKVYGRNGNNASKNITIAIEGDTLSRVSFPAFIPPSTGGGATGSWTAGSGETITVVNGLVISINDGTFLILLENGDSILMENGDRMENA